MFAAYKKFWVQYADFSGRSSRSDFWWVVLCNFLITLPFSLIALFGFLIPLLSLSAFIVLAFQKRLYVLPLNP